LDVDLASIEKNAQLKVEESRHNKREKKKRKERKKGWASRCASRGETIFWGTVVVIRVKVGNKKARQKGPREIYQRGREGGDVPQVGDR